MVEYGVVKRLRSLDTHKAVTARILHFPSPQTSISLITHITYSYLTHYYYSADPSPFTPSFLPCLVLYTFQPRNKQPAQTAATQLSYCVPVAAATLSPQTIQPSNCRDSHPTHNVGTDSCLHLEHPIPNIIDAYTRSLFTSITFRRLCALSAPSIHLRQYTGFSQLPIPQRPLPPLSPSSLRPVRAATASHFKHHRHQHKTEVLVRARVGQDV